MYFWNIKIKIVDKKKTLKHEEEAFHRFGLIFILSNVKV